MINLVGKVGSMALLNDKRTQIDFDKIGRIAKRLVPGVVWVSSGAVEIGRLDYISRAGHELNGNIDEIKTDYAAQGQAILMQTYRSFIPHEHSVRQVLVEHQHFNNPAKRRQIKELFLRCPKQNAIPIVNYNDAVSFEESRKMEIATLRQKNTGNSISELVDNDETASQIAELVETKNLLILTNLDGIYKDINDPNSLIGTITGATPAEVLTNIDKIKVGCTGASRAGAHGAEAKLEHIKPCIQKGIRIYIASAKNDIRDILNGSAPCTRIGVGIN